LMGEDVPFMDLDDSGNLKKWVSRLFK